MYGRNTSRLVWLVVVLLLAIHVGVLAWAATRHSPTLNEPAHLVAGISHWKLGRFELYRVNPPLTRLIAALPVLVAGCECDWRKARDISASHPEFLVAEDFLAANGMRCESFFVLARWACIPLSLIGAMVCFLWARELWGSNICGLIAISLWCFEAMIVAHAELITPDCAATAFGLAAGYTFHRWLLRPVWRRAVLAGLALGFAEAAKMSWVILFGLWPALWLGSLLGVRFWRAEFRGASSAETTRPRFLREGLQMTAILIVAVYMVNVTYAFDESGVRLKDYVYMSKALNGLGVTRAPGNRFKDSLLGNLPVPFPKQYIQGLDSQNCDFEDYPYLNYLRGTFKDGGWWHYYAYGLAVKTTHGLQTLVLLSVGGIWSLRSSLRRSEDTGSKDSVSAPSAARRIGLGVVILLVPPLTLFIIASLRTEINQHVRYVLPCLGAACVLGSASWLLAVRSRGVYRYLAATAVVVCLLANASSTLVRHPDCLAYFNELAGRSEQGHKHLLHSDLDWGQGLVYVREWLETHPDLRPFFLAYQGCAAPADFGITDALPVSASLSHSESGARLTVPPGVYAISANLLAGYPARARSFREGKIVDNALLSAFRKRKPSGHLGFSIVLFDVTEAFHATISSMEIP